MARYSPNDDNALRRLLALAGGQDTSSDGNLVMSVGGPQEMVSPQVLAQIQQIAKEQPGQSRNALAAAIRPPQPAPQPQYVAPQAPTAQATPEFLGDVARAAQSGPYLTDDWHRLNEGLKPTGFRDLGPAGMTMQDQIEFDRLNDWHRLNEGLGHAESRADAMKRMAEAQGIGLGNEKTVAEIAGTKARTASEIANMETPAMKLQKEQDAHAVAMEHLRASQIQNPAMPTGSLGATGPDVLTSLDPGTAGLVKAYAEGRMAFPGGAAMRSPRMMQLLSLVSQYDPTFDATDFNARNKTVADFSTGGKSGQKVQAINQALHHAGQLSDAIDALDNSNVLPGIVNAPVNWAEQKLLGDTRMGVYKEKADALAAELRKVYSGAGGGSLQELNAWQSNFDPNAGKDQQKAYLQGGMQLLQGAINSLADNYARGMGPKADFSKLISPQAQADLAKVMGTPATTAAPAGSSPIQLDTPPAASKYPGKVMTTPDGTKYKSDGKNWVRF